MPRQKTEATISAESSFGRGLYPVQLEPEEDGGYVVTLPDIWIWRESGGHSRGGAVPSRGFSRGGGARHDRSRRGGSRFLPAEGTPGGATPCSDRREARTLPRNAPSRARRGAARSAAGLAPEKAGAYLRWLSRCAPRTARSSPRRPWSTSGRDLGTEVIEPSAVRKHRSRRTRS